MKKLILILIIILITPIILAHQPRITDSQETIVEEPEISKAYYGNLEGNSHIYIINSDKSFNLYVHILVPNINNIDKDISIKINKDGEEFNYLNGTNYEWVEFYEEFAGDSYWAGPEFEQQVSPGNYEIIVSSPDNQGKYSLAIGKIESFPFSEIVNTIFILPSLKKDFFNKSPLTAYSNFIGLFLLIIMIIIATIVFFSIRFYKKSRNKIYKTITSK